MIISISGKIGSGKDLLGKIFQVLLDKPKAFDKLDVITEEDVNYAVFDQPTFEIKKFADKLKDMVCTLLGCTREQLEDREFKEKELGEEWWKYKVHDGSVFRIVTKEYYDSTDKQKFIEKLTPRLLLQLLGTQCGRDILHPNIWCTSLFSSYVGEVEMWRDIEGLEGRYQISSFGRIKGLDRKTVYGDESKGQYHTKKEAILKSTVSGTYEMIKLDGNNSVTIHNLVANHFIPKIKGKEYINHIDQNPLNNYYKNLEWCTQSENILSANSNGNGNIGEKQADAKLTEEDVLQIKSFLRSKLYRQKEIARRFNVSPTTISDIKYNRKWKHVGTVRESLNPILPKSYPNWIITDTRFPNEFEAVKSRGGICIKIERIPKIRVQHSGQKDDFTLVDYDPTNQKHVDLLKGERIASKEHESETALDDQTFDYEIYNNGSIKELVEIAKKFLKDYKIKK